MRDWQMLHDLQALPLEEKIEMSKDRIQEWYEHWDGQVYVSFSGGKDSTVLLHLVRSMYPDVKAMYCDTGLENPDVRQFVMKHENTQSVRPNMTFKEVLTEYGYPIVSKEVAEAIHYARGGLRQGKKKLSWRRAQLYGIPDKPLGGGYHGNSSDSPVGSWEQSSSGGGITGEASQSESALGRKTQERKRLELGGEPIRVQRALMGNLSRESSEHSGGV